MTSSKSRRDPSHWHSAVSAGTDSDGFSIQGQRYAADGSELGGEFQVNTYTTDFQRSPAIAVASNGDFVIVWHSTGSSGDDNSSQSIQGQRYDASGARVGDEFQVDIEFDRDVTGLTPGDFVITNGIAGALEGSGASYALMVAPIAEGIVTVQPPDSQLQRSSKNSATL